MLPSHSALKLLQLSKRNTCLEARAFVFKSPVTWRTILLQNCLSVTIELCVLIRHQLSVQCHSICSHDRIIRLNWIILSSITIQVTWKFNDCISLSLLQYKFLYSLCIYQYQTCLVARPFDRWGCLALLNANKFFSHCTIVLREGGEGVHRGPAVMDYWTRGIARFFVNVLCWGRCTVCCWRFFNIFKK